jgi:DinB superfamily
VSAQSRLASNIVATRRGFLSGTAVAIAGGFAGSCLATQHAAAADATGPNVLGPRPGYSPQIGTFVSQLTWMREQNGVLNYTKGLTQADLDWLFDANANTIGALMLHLAATETYYGMNTFDGMKWGSWSDEVKKKWDAAMDLGDAGRKTIKGHDRDYYVGILNEVREKTLAEFRKKDDAWFMAANKDPDWGGSLANNLAKWFHVCEHESHHCGQIAMLAKRLPGAKKTDAG